MTPLLRPYASRLPRAALVLVLLPCLPARADGPPVAPVRAVIDDYHGTKIADPYRYFEDFKNPQVQAWVRAQGEYAGKTLHSIPGRDRLLERVRELDEAVPYRIMTLRRWPNGDLHYLKRLAEENVEKLYFRDAKTGNERLLVDPERLARDEGKPASEHYSLTFVAPSPDRRYVAYGVALSGSEQSVLRVLDVASGKDTGPADVIDRVEYDYTWPSWLPDSSGFVYSRRRDLPPGTAATELWKRTFACLHRVGKNSDHDAVIFSMDTPAVSMSEGDFPSVVLTAGSRHAIGKIKHGDANELTLYAAPVDRLGTAGVRWERVCDVADEVKEFAVHGDDVYLMTAAGAPRYKVVRTKLGRSDIRSASVVVPASHVVVEGISATKDALYVGLLEAGLNRVARVSYDAPGCAKPQRIEPPDGATAADVVQADADVDGVFIGTRSWTRAGRTFAYDPASGKLTDTGLRPRGKFDDPQGLVAEEVQVASHDGVKVPLSIIRRSDLKLDGKNPTLVIGYGAYGMTMSVAYRAPNLAWLDRGGVIAFAHVRGGGAYGKEWHLAGQKSTKPNTWKDFIACCEYLVKNGYTSPAKLAGEGGSAGGILIGRAITDRPDLFGAAVINVGCTDMLRSETTTNGVPNIQEFGSVATKEGFDALLAMSAYHQVKDGVKYPAVLLTHGVNDPRVEPWMTAKMTARLQAATTSGKPVLFRVDYAAGHGIGSTKRQHQEETADTLAFLLWQLGDPEFQTAR
jgi:prolyl oligopeptidase